MKTINQAVRSLNECKAGTPAQPADWRLISRPRLSRDKPRVLILPNVASWIVGQMAVHIARRFQDDYEFWFLTDKMIRLRPDLVRTLLPELDFIFPLTDKSYKLLRAAAGPMAPATLHILAASRNQMESLDAGGGPRCGRIDRLHRGMEITN